MKKKKTKKKNPSFSIFFFCILFSWFLLWVFFFFLFSVYHFLGCLVWFVVVVTAAAAADSFIGFYEFKNIHKPYLSLPLPVPHPLRRRSRWFSDLQSSGRASARREDEEEGNAIAWILATPDRGLCYNQHLSGLGMAESLAQMAGVYGQFHTLEQLHLYPNCRNPPPLLFHGHYRRDRHRPHRLGHWKRPLLLLGHSSN